MMKLRLPLGVSVAVFSLAFVGCSDHGGMVSLVMPHVFDFFHDQALPSLQTQVGNRLFYEGTDDDASCP